VTHNSFTYAAPLQAVLRPYGLGGTVPCIPRRASFRLALDNEGDRPIRFASTAPRKENDKHAKEEGSMWLRLSIRKAP
jgi:hypothetical protein